MIESCWNDTRNAAQARMNPNRKFKIATPISHLFEKREQAKAILEHSDCLEGREKSLGAPWPLVYLFHTDLEPIHEFGDAEWEHLERIRQKTPELRLLTMHMASCYSAPVVVSGRFQGGGKRYERSEMLRYARENISRIRSILGPSVELAVENNNFLCTAAYDHICDPSFIHEVVNGNGIRFLLDVAHAFVSSTNMAVPLETYLAELPLEKTIQVHVSQHRVDGPRCAVDSHDEISEEMFSFVDDLLNRMSPSYVTLEYYHNASKLLEALKRLDSLGNEYC